MIASAKVVLLKIHKLKPALVSSLLW